MANLRVDNVPVEVLWEIRVAAAADRLTMRDWLPNLIVRELDQEPQECRKAGVLGDVRPSPTRQRRSSEQRAVKFVGQKAPLPQTKASAAEREKRTPCRHGLTFHDLRLVKDLDWKMQQQRVVDYIAAHGYFITDGPPHKAMLLAHPKVAFVKRDPVGYNAVRTPMDLPIARRLSLLWRAHEARSLSRPPWAAAFRLR
jgi:hypothetical protein